MPKAETKLESNGWGLKAIFLTAILLHYNPKNQIAIHREQDGAACPEKAVSNVSKNALAWMLTL